MIAFSLNFKEISNFLLDNKLDSFSGYTKAIIAKDGTIAVHDNSNIILKRFKISILMLKHWQMQLLKMNLRYSQIIQLQQE